MNGPQAAREYAEKAEAFCKAKETKKAVKIVQAENPTAWLHWADYFEFIGMMFSAREMRSPGVSTWKVPSSSPLEFDNERAIEAIEKGDRKRAAMREARTVPNETRRALVEKLQAGVPDDVEEFR
jgi:hypothetical protein